MKYQSFDHADLSYTVMNYHSDRDKKTMSFSNKAFKSIIFTHLVNCVAHIWNNSVKGKLSDKVYKIYSISWKEVSKLRTAILNS